MTKNARKTRIFSVLQAVLTEYLNCVTLKEYIKECLFNGKKTRSNYENNK